MAQIPVGYRSGTPKALDLHLIADNYATHKHPMVKGTRFSLIKIADGTSVTRASFDPA